MRLLWDTIRDLLLVEERNRDESLAMDLRIDWNVLLHAEPKPVSTVKSGNAQTLIQKKTSENRGFDNVNYYKDLRSFQAINERYEQRKAPNKKGEYQGAGPKIALESTKDAAKTILPIVQNSLQSMKSVCEQITLANQKGDCDDLGTNEAMSVKDNFDVDDGIFRKDLSSLQALNARYEQRKASKSSHECDQLDNALDDMIFLKSLSVLQVANARYEQVQASTQQGLSKGINQHYCDTINSEEVIDVEDAIFEKDLAALKAMNSVYEVEPIITNDHKPSGSKSDPDSIPENNMLCNKITAALSRDQNLRCSVSQDVTDDDDTMDDDIFDKSLGTLQAMNAHYETASMEHPFISADSDNDVVGNDVGGLGGKSEDVGTFNDDKMCSGNEQESIDTEMASGGVYSGNEIALDASDCVIVDIGTNEEVSKTTEMETTCCDESQSSEQSKIKCLGAGTRDCDNNMPGILDEINLLKSSSELGYDLDDTGDDENTLLADLGMNDITTATTLAPLNPETRCNDGDGDVNDIGGHNDSKRDRDALCPPQRTSKRQRHVSSNSASSISSSTASVISVTTNSSLTSSTTSAESPGYPNSEENSKDEIVKALPDNSIPDATTGASKGVASPTTRTTSVYTKGRVNSSPTVIATTCSRVVIPASPAKSDTSDCNIEATEPLTDDTPADFSAGLNWVPSSKMTREPKAEPGVVTLMGRYHYFQPKRRMSKRGLTNYHGSHDRSSSRNQPPLAIYSAIQAIRKLGLEVPLLVEACEKYKKGKRKNARQSNQHLELEWLQKNWCCQPYTRGFVFEDESGNKRGTISARYDQPAWLYIRCEAEPSSVLNHLPGSNVANMHSPHYKNGLAVEIMNILRDKATLVQIDHAKCLLAYEGHLSDINFPSGYYLEAETSSRHGTDIGTLFQLYRLLESKDGKQPKKIVVAKCLCSYANSDMCVCGPTIELFETACAWRNHGLGTALLDGIKAHYRRQFELGGGYTAASYSPVLFHVYHVTNRISYRWFVDRGFSGIGEELSMELF